MTRIKLLPVLSIALIIAGAIYIHLIKSPLREPLQSENDGGPELAPHPLSIQALRDGKYSGSEITVEQTLTPGSNYDRYITSYKSEGLKIYALLTVPKSDPPGEGWPAIIFNHGYIPPKDYKTTEKYISYQDAFAKSGYLTFKSDYRGHGNSEGEARGGYGSNDYTIDVLNAVSSIKKFGGVDPDKIGMWGHSMGGSITLRSMVANQDIKAGVIWAGVVGSYEDLFSRWRRRTTTFGTVPMRGGGWRQTLSGEYGTPEENPEFWERLSATTYLTDISGPLSLHHGTLDASVPVEFSKKLANSLNGLGKEVEIYLYEGDDHNISRNLSLALSRSVEFFDKYLKN